MSDVDLRLRYDDVRALLIDRAGAWTEIDAGGLEWLPVHRAPPGLVERLVERSVADWGGRLSRDAAEAIVRMRLAANRARLLVALGTVYGLPSESDIIYAEICPRLSFYARVAGLGGHAVTWMLCWHGERVVFSSAPPPRGPAASVVVPDLPEDPSRRWDALVVIARHVGKIAAALPGGGS